MIALQIQDIKDFMSKLLIGNSFDAFWLSEASITTSVTYTIDGSLRKDFYDTAQQEELQQNRQNLIAWKDVKPFCFSVIKGKRTPLHFKIVFQLSSKNVEKLLFQSGVSLKPEDVFGLYLNLQYDGTHLTCTTGTSLKFFTMDRTLDRVWDDMISRFSLSQKIPVAK